VTDPAGALLSRPPEAAQVASAAIVAFDPGHHIGVAWVDASGRRLYGTIVAHDAIALLPLPPSARLLVGDGTGARAVVAALAARGRPVERVDEVGTTEVGRRLYWRDHPPRGAWRLIPLGLRVPPRLIDDYAAYAIALRALGLTEGVHHR